MSELHTVAEQILDARNTVPAQKSLLTAISGIDGCGKGYLTARLVNMLQSKGMRVAAINIDGWLNLPDKRFDSSNPAEHFYLNAIRFQEMFDQLVIPLRNRRSLQIEANCVEETSTEYSRHIYEFKDIDIIVLEGIYLLKRAFQSCYDLSYWIDCSFDTALERAISRGQEGLVPEETVRAYRTIYFPAQEIHFKRDNPKDAATLIINNDIRLGAVNWNK